MRIIFSFAVLLCAVPAFAQFGGSPGGSPNNALDQLFSATPVYSATMKTSMNGPSGPVTVTAKTYYDHGNTRNEMNLANAQDASLPAEKIRQAKALGLDNIVTIESAARTNIYTMYPALHSYFSVALPDSTVSTNDGVAQTTTLGNDNIAGHPCVKNKVVVNASGQSHTFTVWNATDLKNFPVQISITEEGQSVMMTYQDISFNSVPSSFFQPPSSYKGYDSIEALVQAAVISRMGSIPPPAPVPPPTQ